MRLIDRLHMVTTVVLVIAAVIGAVIALEGQPGWVLWAVGLPVGGAVSLFVHWLFYGL